RHVEHPPDDHQQGNRCRRRHHQRGRPYLGEHDLDRAERHHQQVLDRPVLQLPDDRRPGQEERQHGDVADQLGHRREPALVQVRIVLDPGDKAHLRAGRLPAGEVGQLLGGRVLDVPDLGPGLAHRGGVHDKLNRGTPAPHHVRLKVRGDIEDERVLPGVRRWVDLLDRQPSRGENKPRSPNPVAAPAYKAAPVSRAGRLPLTGTPITKTPRRAMVAKLTRANPTYGSCLPRRNSSLVTGVTYRLTIDPTSFSRTTPTAVIIAGISMSKSMITPGTMA